MKIYSFEIPEGLLQEVKEKISEVNDYLYENKFPLLEYEIITKKKGFGLFKPRRKLDILKMSFFDLRTLLYNLEECDVHEWVEDEYQYLRHRYVFTTLRIKDVEKLIQYGEVYACETSTTPNDLEPLNILKESI